MRMRSLQLGPLLHRLLCQTVMPDAVDWETPVKVEPYVIGLARASGWNARQSAQGVVLRDSTGRRVSPGGLAP